MVISELISSARHRNKLTQSELAQRAGTSQATLSKYESGEAMPTLGTLERLLAACGATLELLSSNSNRNLDVRRGVMSQVYNQRRQITDILTHYDMFNPAIFGSVARGDERNNSDIDIMVDFDVARRGLIPFIEASDALETLLCQQIDLVPRSALAEHVLLQAQREAVPL